MQQISIIITTYNDSEYLAKTLASCLVQDIIPEIIVVDDCSTKKIHCSAAAMISCLTEFMSCEFISLGKNLGLAEARDMGIKSSNGKYILPLDTQDWIYPDVLGEMLKAIEDCDVVYGNMTEYANGPIYPPPGKDGITTEGMKTMNQLWCSSLYRKSALEKVGLYANGLHTSYEDYHLNCKLFMAGAYFKYINRTIYNHTPNPNSMLSQLHKNTDYYNDLARKPLYE